MKIENLQTSSEKGTPKHAKPKSKGIQPCDYTPEPNPEAAKQLHFPHKHQIQKPKNQNTPFFFFSKLKRERERETFGEIDWVVVVVWDFAGANLEQVVFEFLGEVDFPIGLEVTLWLNRVVTTCACFFSSVTHLLV